MKKIKPFTFLLFLFTVLFLLFAPGLIRSGLDKTKSTAQKTGYKGIMSLWHINGWQAGKAPVNSYLKKCIRDFENKNAYVFIEVTTLTPAKAAERLSAGELPDIISFPTGFFSEPTLLAPLDKTAYSNASLADSCLFGGKVYAFAYMVNPYLLIYNQEFLFEKELDEAAFEKPTLDTLLAAARTLSFTRTEGKKKKEVYGMAAQPEYITTPFASLAFIEENEQKETGGNEAGVSGISVQTAKGTELFIQRQAAFLIASGAAPEVLKNSKQTPPAFEARAFCAYSDMVQYMGICKTEDAAKINCCKSFLYSLLNEKNTKRMEALGVFPVLLSEELYADDPLLKDAYRLLMEKGVFPNTFAYAGLQQDLASFAKSAAEGDMNSIRKLRNLLSKKLYS